jgi:flagellar biosynthetic protein FlhB
LLQALIAMPVIAWLTWIIVRDHLAELLRLPLLPVHAITSVTGALFQDTLRRSAFVLTVLGSIMLLRERMRYTARLRMSRNEVRDEAKESEGNPQIKARIRRIQRDMRRRNMMREVPTATAVVVNPTHYAVAIRYDQATMAAPLVVAKGKNYLAARIRLRATENQIPIIENPPLAQALYKTVDIGQEVPPHLYRAVAEILAYIFRLMGNKR